MKPKGGTNERSIALLGLGAVCAVLLTCGGALLTYNSTQRLTRASEWVAHTQEVLTTLQSVVRNIDRVEMESRIYRLTRNESDRATVQRGYALMEGDLTRLTRMVADNGPQYRSAMSLDVCRWGAVASAADAELASGAYSWRLLECHQTISRMQEVERSLLRDRAADSSHASMVSLASGVFSGVLAAAVNLVLFGFMLRDTRRHRVVGRQLLAANLQSAETVRMLERRASTARILSAARIELQLCVSAADAYSSAKHFAEQLLPGSSGTFAAIDNSRRTVQRVSAWGAASPLLDSFSLDACCGLRSGHSRWRLPDLSSVHCSHFAGPPPERYVCIPMAALGETIGFLYLEVPDAENEQSLGPLDELLECASLALSGLQLREKLEAQSIRDPLTGLFNRRFMEIALDRELRRAVRQQSTLAVLMLDVDHFKQFNDTFGHPAGDAVLREIAAAFGAVVRAEDIACRYGGEEFAILLPEIPAAAALKRAEAVRQAVAGIRLCLGPEPAREVNISIGLAMYPEDGHSPETLVRAADRNLYEAKRQGRNRVVLTERAEARSLQLR